jgi:prefoldin subunit 5
VSNWKEEARERLDKQEERLFKQSGKVTEQIEKITGKELTPAEFFNLRNLFSQFENLETEIQKTQDRLWELN